jgi:hypothetical protein
MGIGMWDGRQLVELGIRGTGWGTVGFWLYCVFYKGLGLLWHAFWGEFAGLIIGIDSYEWVNYPLLCNVDP